jgi:PIN domain nuclease of toxin-antitoxin system
MGVLLDSPAILAYLWDGPGADRVESAFASHERVACTVANWAEIVTKVLSRKRPRCHATRQVQLDGHGARSARSRRRAM